MTLRRESFQTQKMFISATDARWETERLTAFLTDVDARIGALLFFLPGAGITMKNVEEAAKAAKDRALHLNKLKEKKDC